MKKSITIALADPLAQWARIEAAKAGMSLSRWIGDTLAKLHREQTDRRRALQRFLAAPDFPGVAADLPDREELYAERVFRRLERK